MDRPINLQHHSSTYNIILLTIQAEFSSYFKPAVAPRLAGQRSLTAALPLQMPAGSRTTPAATRAECSVADTDTPADAALRFGHRGLGRA